MNTEFSYLLSLLVKQYPGPRDLQTVFRIVYARALNKYEDQYKSPEISKYNISNFRDAKTIEKHASAAKEGSLLVILFRNATPVYLHWGDKVLRQVEDAMPPLGQWIGSIVSIHTDPYWESDLKALKKDPKDFLRSEHLSIRSVVYRTTAIDKVRRMMVLCREANDETLSGDATVVLKFMYDCNTLCGFKVPPKPWLPIELKEQCQAENDVERDLYVKLFRSSYDAVKLDEMKKMLISCATDMWDEYGYTYPQYFTNVGEPVENRYMLFVSFSESTRLVTQQGLKKTIEK